MPFIPIPLDWVNEHLELAPAAQRLPLALRHLIHTHGSKAKQLLLHSPQESFIGYLGLCR